MILDHALLGEITIIEKNSIGDILNALSGATKTLRPAIYDYPTGSDYLIIRVHQNDNRGILDAEPDEGDVEPTRGSVSRER